MTHILPAVFSTPSAKEGAGPPLAADRVGAETFDGVYAEATKPADPAGVRGARAHEPADPARDARAPDSRRTAGTARTAPSSHELPGAGAMPQPPQAAQRLGADGTDPSADPPKSPRSSLEEIFHRSASVHAAQSSGGTEASPQPAEVSRGGEPRETLQAKGPETREGDGATRPPQVTDPRRETQAPKTAVRAEASSGVADAQPAMGGAPARRHERPTSGQHPTSLVQGHVPSAPAAPRDLPHTPTRPALRGAASVAPGVTAPPPLLRSGLMATGGVGGAEPARAAPETQTQVFQSAGVLASAGGGSAKVTLHPETLGTVVVQVQVTPHGVTNVQMTASTDDGYRTLAASAGQLAQHLAHGGLVVGSVQASLAGAGPAPAHVDGAPAHGAPTGFQPGAGGFSGTRQQSGGGHGQFQPQDMARDTPPSNAPRPADGPDETVKAYA